MTVTFPFAVAITFAISLASASTTTIPSLELVNVTAREADVGPPVTVAVKRTASPTWSVALAGVISTLIASMPGDVTAVVPYPSDPTQLAATARTSSPYLIAAVNASP